MTQLYSVWVYERTDCASDTLWTPRLVKECSPEEQRNLKLVLHTRYDFYTPEHADQSIEIIFNHRGSGDDLRSKLNSLLLESAKRVRE